jgi:hypothetical protein
MLHELPSITEVQEYENDEGMGPNCDDLHLDLRHGPESTWNSEIIEILLEKLTKKQADERWCLPKVSERYLADLLRSKFKRAKGFWMAAQPRIGANGERETPVEAEARLNVKGSVTSKLGRAGQRRLRVSCQLL